MHAGVLTNEGGEFNVINALPPSSSAAPCASVSNGMVVISTCIRVSDNRFDNDIPIPRYSGFMFHSHALIDSQFDS